MTDQQTYKYEPVTVSHPGASLRRALDALGLTAAGLAHRSATSRVEIDQVLDARAPITADMALAFVPVLGVPATFWNARQKAYDEAS